MPLIKAAGRPERRVSVFYHYLFPDPVVSAVHMDELCQGLAARGWSVTAFPGNRGCRDESVTYNRRALHAGVELRRVWRPRLAQNTSAGRMLNAFWMALCWSLLAVRANPPDAIVVGTDPVLSVAIALVWKWLRPRTKVLHWCFDLYPEAAYADGVLRPDSLLGRLLDGLLKRAYAACDVLVDIGPCMRERLGRYPSRAKPATVVPWALKEPGAVLPIAPEERRRIFGNAELAMLYSGNFGRAHRHEELLLLGQRLKGESARLAFSVQGNREAELRAAVSAASASGSPVVLVPYAPAEQLLDRLAAPDVHLLSLAPEWTGLVVPSKFFGAIAAGRPVVFSGSPNSAVARWIRQYELGWVLEPESVAAVAEDLREYSRDPARREAMCERCAATYREHFSRQPGLDRMHALLLETVDPRAQRTAESSAAR